MPDVFITDKRRAVLEGKYEGAKNTERTHKSRIRARSRQALEELIEVAESQEIDNREVFDPDDVFRLLSALMAPDDYTGPAYPSPDAPEAWMAYHYQLETQLEKLLLPNRGEAYNQ